MRGSIHLPRSQKRVMRGVGIFCYDSIDVCLQCLFNLFAGGTRQTTTAVDMGLPAESAGTLLVCILVCIDVVPSRGIVANGRWVPCCATSVGFMPVGGGTELSFLLKCRAAGLYKAFVDTGS